MVKFRQSCFCAWCDHDHLFPWVGWLICKFIHYILVLDGWEYRKENHRGR